MSTNPKPASRQRRAWLMPIALLLVVAAGCGSDELPPDLQPAKEQRWAVPSIEPGQDLSDAQLMRYVRVIQKIIYAAKNNDCDTITNLIAPDSWAADTSNFCERNKSALAKIDPSQGKLTSRAFRGPDGELIDVAVGLRLNEWKSLGLYAEGEGPIQIANFRAG